jgi:hypothetical protein
MTFRYATATECRERRMAKWRAKDPVTKRWVCSFDDAQTLRDLQGMAEARGYNPRWVDHVLEARARRAAARQREVV